AMFPVPFAFDVIDRYTPHGGRVLDPFAGRGSSVYAAAATGREALGIEINRVGWVYSQAKLAPASDEQVLARLRDVGAKAKLVDTRSLDNLPKFFRACYSDDVLRFLVAARSHLRWRRK